MSIRWLLFFVRFFFWSIFFVSRSFFCCKTHHDCKTSHYCQSTPSKLIVILLLDLAHHCWQIWTHFELLPWLVGCDLVFCDNLKRDNPRRFSVGYPSVINMTKCNEQHSNQSKKTKTIQKFNSKIQNSNLKIPYSKIKFKNKPQKYNIPQIEKFKKFRKFTTKNS